MLSNDCPYFKFIDHDTPIRLQLTFQFMEDRIDEAVLNEIKRSNIYLFYSISPGCISKVLIDQNTEKIERLIVIDKTMTSDLLKFDPTEIAAEILHEVGHFLNKEPDNKKSDTEFYADDYARKNGLGFQLASGFKKYIKVIEDYTSISDNRYFFRDAATQTQIVNLLTRRIERIEKKEDVLIGGV